MILALTLTLLLSALATTTPYGSDNPLVTGVFAYGTDAPAANPAISPYGTDNPQATGVFAYGTDNPKTTLGP